MVFDEVKRPFIERCFELPELKKGEALIEIEYATICSSDLHTFLGRRHAPHPSILGHEIIGRVARLGEGVRSTHRYADALHKGVQRPRGLQHKMEHFV